MTDRLVTLVTMIGAVAAVMFTTGEKPPPILVLNASESVPMGLYRVRPIGKLAVTNLAVALPPEPLATLLAEKDYLPRGVPLIKRVLALPGQTVCRRMLAIVVDGIEHGISTRGGPPWPRAPAMAGLSSDRGRRGVPHELGRTGIARWALFRGASHDSACWSSLSALDVREGLIMRHFSSSSTVPPSDLGRVVAPTGTTLRRSVRPAVVKVASADGNFRVSRRPTSARSSLLRYRPSAASPAVFGISCASWRRAMRRRVGWL